MTKAEAARSLLRTAISLLSPCDSEDDAYVEKLIMAMALEGIGPAEQCGALASIVVNGVEHGTWPHVLERMPPQ